MSQVKKMPDALTKGEEAGCSEGAGPPVPPAPRQLRVVDGREAAEGAQPTKTLSVLAKVSLVMAGIIFFCQVVVAACLCRPVVVMGGVWVGVLVLVQGVLGLRATSSHALLVGHAWVSGVVCLVCVAAAAYLFSGHLTLACVSAFHRPDHASVIRLYVVEVVGLVACLPSLAAAVVCLLSAALSARAACPPKPKRREAPFVLYLPRWGEDTRYGNAQPGPMRPPAALPNHQPSTSTTSPTSQAEERASSPPPAYNQVAEESYA